MSTAILDQIGFLSRAAAKAAGSVVRRYGLAPVAEGWEDKAALCERCHLRVVRCGISYCGKPFLTQIDRDESVDGCGCPCHEKAKTPGEHCPLDRFQLAAKRDETPCNCKWCSASIKNLTTDS
jgi:hypothetical protein